MRSYQVAGHLVTFLGILAICSSAPDRLKRQSKSSVPDPCLTNFNVTCDDTTNTSTQPPLDPVVDKVAEPLDGECVLDYQCRNNDAANTDGSTIIDRRFPQLCRGESEVFCKKSSIDRNASKPTTETAGTTGGTAGGNEGTSGTGGTGGTMIVFAILVLQKCLL